MSAPAASIIIATYRREQALRETLLCVAALQTPSLEVFVIDQTPDHEPETDALLAQLAASQRIFYLRIRRPSLPLARNVGLALARGPIVIFIDDDVVFGPDFVTAHLAAFADPNIYGSAGRVHLQARTPGEQLLPDVPPATSDEWFDMLTPLPAVATARGCNMAFRREVALRLGGFDTQYLTSTVEDEDFCFGIRSLAGRIVFTPQAWLIHRMDPGGTRTRPDDIQGRAEYFHDRIYFILKNTSLWAGLRTLGRTYRNSIANQRVLSFGLSEVGRRHLALLCGGLAGIRIWRARGRVRRRLSFRV